ncbi:uncharacterized protein LOC9656306 [Selaginella moellendorffii]|nr:uncharacterized protein LOC9656306 [Selaginella moellendorffii]|eukprot:XP_002980549.2 uncharacterized protein LOC9656306 [Selaginella moellendorffii]
MVWSRSMLDAVLVPVAILIIVAYHIFLLYKIRKDPLQTVIGINNIAKRAWVRSIMKDMDKKNILAVQTLRNSIMASTLMASTAILLTSGVAAFLSSNYSVKRPLESAVYGARDDFSVAVKFLSLLACFLFSFLCYMQSIRFVNNVNYLINVPPSYGSPLITPEFVGDVLVRGFAFYSIGTRAFYVAFPLLLWIYGPIPVLLCSIALVPVLYHLDVSGDVVGAVRDVDEKPVNQQFMV